MMTANDRKSIKIKAFVIGIFYHNTKLIKNFLNDRDILIYLELNASFVLEKALNSPNFEVITSLLKVPAVAAIVDRPSNRVDHFFLSKAAYFGHYDILNCLFDHFDKEKRTPDLLNAPLRSALSQGHFDCALYLYKRGASLSGVGERDLKELVHSQAFSLALIEKCFKALGQDDTVDSSTSLYFARGIFSRLVADNKPEPIKQILGYLPIVQLSLDDPYKTMDETVKLFSTCL